MVDLIVRRWPPVRIPLLVLGIWGLTFMIGLLFGMLVRPHAVGPDGPRIRSGSEIDLVLTWDDVAAVTRCTRRVNEKEPRVTVDPNGEATLHLRIQDETNLDVRLERPTTLRLPSGPETVSSIALWADDPKGFLAAARRYPPCLIHSAEGVNTWRKPTVCLLGGSGKPWAPAPTSCRGAGSLRPTGCDLWHTPSLPDAVSIIPSRQSLMAV